MTAAPTALNIPELFNRPKELHTTPPIVETLRPHELVVYSNNNFEPIIIIPASEELYKALEAYDVVKIPLFKNYPSTELCDPPDFAEVTSIKVVMGSTIRYLVISINDEKALRLRGIFPPGYAKELIYMKEGLFKQFNEKKNPKK